jgi:hypothetical protein
VGRKGTHASSASFSSSANPFEFVEQGRPPSFQIRMFRKPEAIMVRTQSSASVAVAHSSACSWIVVPLVILKRTDAQMTDE